MKTDGIEFLSSLDDNSIDLIITDPPYLISKESGMEKFQKEVKKLDESENKNHRRVECLKQKVMKMINIKITAKYGNTSGNKYAFKTDFGVWDKEFTIEKLKQFIGLFQLQKGGTVLYSLIYGNLKLLKD